MFHHESEDNKRIKDDAKLKMEMRNLQTLKDKGENKVVQNFITREELTRVIHKKSTSFCCYGRTTLVVWCFLLFVPLIIYLLYSTIFFPFYYVETKMKGEI